MNTAPQMDRLTASPGLFPFGFDAAQRAVQFVALSEADYRTESFLDGRLAIVGRNEWLAWEIVEAALIDAPPPQCHFIFHIGHVGSTLLSRLVGEHGSLFSLREPDLLRGLAKDATESATSPVFPPGSATVLLKLFGRTWRPNQTAIIKATSFVSEIAADLMDRAPQSRAILMFVNPLAYLRTAMGGRSTRLELREGARARLDRLHRRMGERPWRLETLSEGEVIALSWLSETSCLVATAGAYPTRCSWINFDTFLQDPFNGLTDAFSGLAAPSTAGQIQALVEGPIMQRYSKAPEHPYDADLRRAVLGDAERHHSAEIRKGMLWLGAAADHPFVRTVLETAAHQRARSSPL